MTAIPRLRFRARVALLGLCLAGLRAADAPSPPPISVKAGADGRLAYTADANGDRVIDFSAAGYDGGGVAIPHVPARIVVRPEGPNDGARIQAALDLVAAMPRDAQGFRGAVLLAPGRFAIASSLQLNASGVVLRGSGQGENGTVLSAVGESRRTLIEIGGRGERTEFAGTRRNVTDAYVPVGARQLSVDDASAFPVGTRVVVRRPCTAAWIAELGMDSFSGWRPENRISWAPGSRDLVWERTVVAVAGNALTFDAPLTTSLDAKFGGGTVARCEFPGRIDHVGVENLRCVSEHRSGVPDEEHAWCCVSLDAVENAWVRQLTARHFVGYVVITHPGARALTIEDCSAQDPVSELAAYRRRVFSIGGELTLVQRCDSMHGLHDFTTGFAAAGPNVFFRCTAREALDWSGPVDSWASGVLYDNVVIRGNALRFLDRGADGQGAGWTVANSLLWNCESTELQVQSPPGAANQAYGCKGLIVDDRLRYDPRRMPFQPFVHGGASKPESLYLAQLAERKGHDAVATLARATIPVSAEGLRELAASDLPPPAPRAPVHPLRVEHAQFTIDGQPAWTNATNWSWFTGQAPRQLARSFGAAITRFTPGETGLGQTDHLEDVIAALPPGGVFVHHYGLWYDRRRINHNFYGAPELPASDVSAPFMEMPWARSGQGTDWDGMSKYDLTRFNPWFFGRVKAFADLADTHGRVLYFNVYFQHPVQETRAHYVDFPWRPVNCLQATDLPDENPAGSTFYDIAHPVRRDLHRRYIFHCLDVLKANANVVFGIDREYSGPLSFAQFWLDTIAEWEKANGKKVLVALEVPKAEMDALLADPVRGPMITAIDFHHWYYQADGSLFAIEGGLNLAPREQLQRAAASPNPPKPGGAEQRYRALREYRDAFPELVILRKPDDFPTLTAAIEKTIPAAARAQTRASMLVQSPRATSWAMAAKGRAYLVYTLAGDAVTLDLTSDHGSFKVAWLDGSTGELGAAREAVVAGNVVTLAPPTTDTKRPWVAWLTR